MIEGFGLQLVPESYRIAWGVTADWQIGYRFGGRWYAQIYPLTDAVKLMREIEVAAGHRSQTLTGFTLFYQPTKQAWQMSVRRDKETGWDVGTIDEAKAQTILALLENSGHPDGPWTVKASDAKSIDLVAANRAAQARLSSALARWVGA